MGKAQAMNRAWEKYPQLDVEVVAEIVSAAWDASMAESRPLLSEIDLVWGSPGDIEMTSDGGGEFASVFRLNARGIAKVLEAGDSR